MRLAFLGTPDFAVPVLRALAAEHEVVKVVTRADRRRSRRGHPEPSAVKAAALELGLPVGHRPEEALDAAAELGVVVAFGRIIKPAVLNALGMVNLHLSLLPRWRGAAPVQRAILAGDEETGICLMQLDEGLDTGPVHDCRRTPVEPDDTTASLTGRLIEMGIPLLLESLAAGLGPGTPQQGEPAYAAKIGPEDLRLRWDQPAAQLDRVVRVGGAWTTFRGRRLNVLAARPVPGAMEPGGLERLGADVRVGTASGCLVVGSVRPEGRRDQSATDWWNGQQPRPGEKLE